MQTRTDIDIPEQLIAGHPFFNGLAPSFVHMLKDTAMFNRYDTKEAIINEGAVADHFYLIHTGTVSLEAYVPGRGSVVVQILGAGEALGCSWLYPPHRWHFSALPLEPAEITTFDARVLRKLASENPDIGYELAYRTGEVAWQRLQATRALLVDFYGKTE
ncbi:MAG TPA: cyclic nucleotide-binding domain-containing protein [Chthoniobacteraceae bacterium]|nr:cyclic nucleotide-binding domain-containing protein [Chthoniobacteraceae bacterium]